MHAFVQPFYSFNVLDVIHLDVIGSVDSKF